MRNLVSSKMNDGGRTGRRASVDTENEKGHVFRNMSLNTMLIVSTNFSDDEDDDEDQNDTFTYAPAHIMNNSINMRNNGTYFIEF